MSHIRLAAVLATATVAIGLAGVSDARAEFFGCNDRPGQVLYDSSWHNGGSRYARYTHDYSAKPHRTSHARVTHLSVPRYYSARYR